MAAIQQLLPLVFGAMIGSWSLIFRNGHTQIIVVSFDLVKTSGRNVMSERMKVAAASKCARRVGKVALPGCDWCGYKLRPVQSSQLLGRLWDAFP